MDHLTQALRQIKRIESERTLLNGHFSKVAKEYGVSVKSLRAAYTDSNTMKPVRIAALAHEALGITRVKVIFKDGGRDNRDGTETAYFMDRETYRAIELGVEATLADYQAIADGQDRTITEAQNTDIYSNK